MPEEKYTATPWILGGSAAWSQTAKDRGPVFICDIREGTHVPVGTNQANARLIVHAVNNHEALIAALREAIEIIKIWHGPEAWDIYNEHSPEMIRINEALASAEKGSE